MPPGGESWIEGENMRALKVLGVVALIVGAFAAGGVMDPEADQPVLVCGEYTWANEDMTGCEVLPEFLALIENNE
jgi:hypothetical protein